MQQVEVRSDVEGEEEDLPQEQGFIKQNNVTCGWFSLSYVR